MADKPRFEGDMRWVRCWVDDCGNQCDPRWTENPTQSRILQIGVATWAGPFEILHWEDVPEVDEA